MDINVELVKKLVSTQFPQWQDLAVKPVEKSGNDNRTFRLGNDMSVRLPSAECYASAIEKEQKYLPTFKKHLSINITTPLAFGKPTVDYPFNWSINNWLDGENVTFENVPDKNQFAKDLANFLLELRSIDATNGIPAGVQNFYRGGDLSVYNNETLEQIKNLPPNYNKKITTEIWNLSLATKFNSKSLWVHGDIAVGNLLVKDGKLCGVIDFGTMGTGDLSSDIVMAWNYFDIKSRKIFLDTLNVDMDTINRGRGWALWKAIISTTYNEKESELANFGKRVIDVILEEYEYEKSLEHR